MKTNLRDSSKIIFEGAGWESAESNGVGNCRIRTTFEDAQGQAIYLEMGGHARSPYCIKSQIGFDFPWHISSAFYVKDAKCRYSEGIRYVIKNMQVREYTKKNILALLKELGANFTEMEVDNKTWNGFNLSGEQDETN